MSADQAVATSRATPAGRPRRRATLLPDPEPRPVRYPIISVDDHLVEPPDLFDGRLPARLADRAPRVVTADDGRQGWAYEGRLYTGTGLSAIVGRPKEEWVWGDPQHFDEMRRGCWDVHERVRDMDVIGEWASVCFPSSMAGFGGRTFITGRDPELGLACVRAYNDWHLEAWAGAYPDRFIPMQLAWLADPRLAAADIERNAARGFKAVTFPERPEVLGFPSMQSDWWDPLLRACEATGTVVCLHVGSSSWVPIDRAEAPLELKSTLFTVNAIVAAADWVWSGVPVRFPELRIVLSEGGVGWVPMLLDRFDYILEHTGHQLIVNAGSWRGDLTPSEVLLRNFWFCTLDDPSMLPLRHRIGVDHILLEVDYPHGDSTWPDTPDLIERRFGELPEDEVRRITSGNAAALFRHPLPPDGFGARPEPTGDAT